MAWWSGLFSGWFGDRAKPKKRRRRRRPKNDEPFLPPVAVFRVDDADPRLLAAAAEARARWPEFVAAFGRRQPIDSFAVKAPFTEDERTEVLWMSVESLEGDHLSGELDTEPELLKRLKHGSRVRAKAADVADWSWTRAGRTEGNFTTQALVRIRKEALAEGAAKQAQAEPQT